jgi:hypothetical protein
MNGSPLWYVALAGAVLSVAAMLGGGIIDPGFGALLSGYGVLLAVATAYLGIGLMVWSWRRRRQAAESGRARS